MRLRQARVPQCLEIHLGVEPEQYGLWIRPSQSQFQEYAAGIDFDLGWTMNQK